jgi:hypothetical protein
MISIGLGFFIHYWPLLSPGPGPFPSHWPLLIFAVARFQIWNETLFGPHSMQSASELPGNAMPAYRIYTVGDDANFSNAPEFVVCADDKEAIERRRKS